MPADGLFGPMSTTVAMAEAVSSGAWLQAMLDVEAALAAAEASAGVIPAEVAPIVAAACRAELFDVDELGRAAAASASAVVPLVAALRVALPDEAAAFVHWGATSQDILDTAMMLVSRRAIDLLLADLAATAGLCAHLAEAHRRTLMAGRTLLQQAVPISFGLKAAGWLMAVLDARTQLANYRESRLAIQFGGAAGTLAALGGDGLRVAELLAAELDLAEPALPWHTARGRVAEVKGGSKHGTEV